MPVHKPTACFTRRSVGSNREASCGLPHGVCRPAAWRYTAVPPALMNSSSAAKASLSSGVFASVRETNTGSERSVAVLNSSKAIPVVSRKGFSALPGSSTAMRSSGTASCSAVKASNSYSFSATRVPSPSTISALTVWVPSSALVSSFSLNSGAMPEARSIWTVFVNTTAPLSATTSTFKSPLTTSPSFTPVISMVAPSSA